MASSPDPGGVSEIPIGYETEEFFPVYEMPGTSPPNYKRALFCVPIVNE